MKMDKLIILSIHGIGDAIMLTPMIQLLGEKSLAAKITVLTTLEGSKQVFETCPYVSEVIKVERRTLRNISSKYRLFFYLRRQRFDVCITAFTSNIVDNVFAGCIQARYRIGHSYPLKGIMGLSFIQNVRVPMHLDKHAVRQNLNLLKPLQIKLPECEVAFETKMWLTSQDITVSQRFLHEHGITGEDMIIGFHPGSSDEWAMIYKRWPKEKFAVLGDSILHEYPNTRILIFGGPKEEGLKSEIKNLMARKPIIVSNTSLRETAALIKRCNVFISNDSGLMHVAAAMKTPTVAIFGPTNPVATAPYGNGHLIVAKDISCRPCWPIKNYVNNPKCKRNSPYICLSQLPVSKVFEAAKTLIQT